MASTDSVRAGIPEDEEPGMGNDDGDPVMGADEQVGIGSIA